MFSRSNVGMIIIWSLTFQNHDMNIGMSNSTPLIAVDSILSAVRVDERMGILVFGQ